MSTPRPTVLGSRDRRGRRQALKDGHARNADLSGAVLAQSELYKVNLDDSFPIGANLEGANLAEASLNRADLRGAVSTKRTYRARP